MHIERKETTAHVVFRIFADKAAKTPTYEFAFTKFKFDDEPWVGHLDSVTKNGVQLSQDEGMKAYNEYAKYAKGCVYE